MGYNGVFISVVFVQMESVPETNIIETFYVANNLLILIMGIFFMCMRVNLVAINGITLEML